MGCTACDTTRPAGGVGGMAAPTGGVADVAGPRVDWLI